MIRRLVHFALHQPLFAGMLAVLFVAGGVVAFLNLPIEAFPDVSDTQVNVIALFPGRAPEEVERSVTIPLETVLSGVPHSVRLFSHTQFGLSFIMITFDDKVTETRCQAWKRVSPSPSATTCWKASRRLTDRWSSRFSARTRKCCAQVSEVVRLTAN